MTLPSFLEAPKVSSQRRARYPLRKRGGWLEATAESREGYPRPTTGIAQASYWHCSSLIEAPFPPRIRLVSAANVASFRSETAAFRV